MLFLPFRTESALPRNPYANCALITINAIVFAFVNLEVAGPALGQRVESVILTSYNLHLHQYFTYQFLHGDWLHLAGNMLFLWVFGNSVNAKLGQGPYILFYLAGGVFAAWFYGLVADGPYKLIGASGAIASVTTAYLALFPRARVTMLLWVFLFIYFVRVPALVVIGFKIILWDNIIAPAVGDASNVAHAAHLGGYAFGFIAAVLMLLVGALPRDRFDLIGVVRRARGDRPIGPRPRASAEIGQARPIAAPAGAGSFPFAARVAELRTVVSQRLGQEQPAEAAEAYQHLLRYDPRQCLSEAEQLAVARALYQGGEFGPATTAFELYLRRYNHSSEAPEVQLLLGIILLRDLARPQAARPHLEEAAQRLRDPPP